MPIQTHSLASEVARYLLQINAIKVEEKNFFTWASGLKSPIYCDIRRVYSYPTVRIFLKSQLMRIIEEQVGKVDMIAGVATGGIPFGILIAQTLNLPFVYVRPSAKAHGLAKTVEGNIIPGMSAVVIEDLISTGGSSITATKHLKESGIEIKALLAIFSYALKAAEDNIAKAEIPTYVLSDFNALRTLAETSAEINKNQLAMLDKWHQDPENFQ